MELWISYVFCDKALTFKFHKNCPFHSKNISCSQFIRYLNSAIEIGRIIIHFNDVVF